MTALKNEINQLRKKIDEIDQKILDCISQRMQTVSLLSEKKHKAKLPIYDALREKELKKLWSSKASEHQLDINHTYRILNELLEMSKKIQ